MSIQMWAELEGAKKRILALESDNRELRRIRTKMDMELLTRLEALEAWVIARKPGPKPKDVAHG